MEIILGMTAIVTAGRLALAVVLIAAGIAKLSRPESPVAAMQDFGIRLPVRPQWVVRGLAMVELALGLALGSGVGLLIAGPLAVAMLTLFTVVIIASLARGRRFPCHCFGPMSTRPIGPHTVTRNAVLLILALATCAQVFRRVAVSGAISLGPEPRPTGGVAEWGVLLGGVGLLLALVYLLDNLDFSFIGLLYRPP